jgi:hypothetical protein
VPRVEGVETKQIKTSYSTAAGTAYITFNNVKVPAENMLGPENGGLLVILSNFNVRYSFYPIDKCEGLTISTNDGSCVALVSEALG